MFSLILRLTPNVTGTLYKLPASKSISNRVLIMDALSGNQSTVRNLANARDTQLMAALLKSEDKVIDAMDAGTTMRFLTAYFAITGQQKILTGTARMKQRPIGMLVDALRKIGAEIEFLEQDGFPPVEIKGFGKQLADEVTLPGNVSSQYISALMMMAPRLEHGLTINLTGPVGSRPYIEMTATLMKTFGVTCSLAEQQIRINPADYKPAAIQIEPDWSAISYWLAVVALAEKAEVTLKDVDSNSIQGDRVIVELMEKLGVTTQFENGDAQLTKSDQVESHLEWDFKTCPDLAQTVLPVCALKGVKGTFTGLESLYIKETDRILALQKELSKVGATLTETIKGTFELSPGQVPQGRIKIKTYHDHRMAMGFASWATMMDLEIEDPEVVNKSYPDFWQDLSSLGIKN